MSIIYRLLKLFSFVIHAISYVCVNFIFNHDLNDLKSVCVCVCRLGLCALASMDDFYFTFAHNQYRQCCPPIDGVDERKFFLLAHLYIKKLQNRLTSFDKNFL